MANVREPKSKSPKLTDGERHKRFVQMAREVGASEDFGGFRQSI